MPAGEPTNQANKTPKSAKKPVPENSSQLSIAPNHKVKQIWCFQARNTPKWNKTYTSLSHI